MKRLSFALLTLIIMISCNNLETEKNYKSIINETGLTWQQANIKFVQSPGGEEKPYWSGLFLDSGESIEVETDFDYFYVEFLDEEYYYRKTELVPFRKGKGIAKHEDVLEEKVHQTERYN